VIRLLYRNPPWKIDCLEIAYNAHRSTSNFLSDESPAFSPTAQPFLQACHAVLILILYLSFVGNLSAARLRSANFGSNILRALHSLSCAVHSCSITIARFSYLIIIPDTLQPHVHGLLPRTNQKFLFALGFRCCHTRFCVITSTLVGARCLPSNAQHYKISYSWGFPRSSSNRHSLPCLIPLSPPLIRLRPPNNSSRSQRLWIMSAMARSHVCSQPCTMCNMQSYPYCPSRKPQQIIQCSAPRTHPMTGSSQVLQTTLQSEPM